MNRIAILLTLAGTLLLAACDDAPHKPRRQQTVKLLPDTPPPPKPPEQRPQPKPEEKPPADAPKPDDAPQAQALKTDEAAGDGPGSGLASGAVSQDYQGGPTGVQVGGGSQEATPNRLALTSYAQATTRSLNEFLVRDKDVKRLDYQVRIDLWLNTNGSYQRAQLVGSTGDPATDQALRAALGRFQGAGSPLPPSMPQPLRVLVSNRLMG